MERIKVSKFRSNAIISTKFLGRYNRNERDIIKFSVINRMMILSRGPEKY